DVRHLPARGVRPGQRAVRRDPGAAGAGAVLVRRLTPVLAGPAAAGAGVDAPEDAALAVVGRAGPGVAAQVVHVPDRLAAARVGRVRPGARVEVLERGAAHAGDPRLRGRVV